MFLVLLRPAILLQVTVAGLDAGGGAPRRATQVAIMTQTPLPRGGLPPALIVAAFWGVG